MKIQMLEERVQELEKKIDKKIKHNKALAKKVTGFMRNASRLKNEATKDMVSRRFDGSQGCSKVVHR
jgi:phage gpG-like protein